MYTLYQWESNNQHGINIISTKMFMTGIMIYIPEQGVYAHITKKIKEFNTLPELVQTLLENKYVSNRRSAQIVAKGMIIDNQIYRL